MYLTRHETEPGPRWALDGRWLMPGMNLLSLLEMRRAEIMEYLSSRENWGTASGTLVAPLDMWHEVWAAGVTYLRSREARRAESSVADVYDKVYDAARPELFFKSIGWRVVGPGQPIRTRRDSRWNVPEPEMTLVINRHGEIVGYCAGNDMSSRDIEGENPLYLPQAKIYNGACALGPGLFLAEPDELRDMPIQLEILRNTTTLFQGETRTSNMKRDLRDLVAFLGRELDFPYGVFLMTGTGIVPGDDVTLHPGDVVRVKVGPLVLENPVR